MAAEGQEQGAEGLSEVAADASAQPLADVQAEAEAEEGIASMEAAGGAEVREEREGRRGRGRDRFRRERREQESGAPGATGDEGLPVVPTVDVTAEAALPARLPEDAIVTAPEPILEEAPHVEPVEPVVPAPVMAPAPVPAPAPAPAAPVARVAAYTLPMDDLRTVATSAGLEWVNSDADKVRLAQEAIANTPLPIHVPREPKTVVPMDDGPLVLVETRKDLAQFALPFSHQQADAFALKQQQQHQQQQQQQQ